MCGRKRTKQGILMADPDPVCNNVNIPVMLLYFDFSEMLPPGETWIKGMRDLSGTLCIIICHNYMWNYNDLEVSLTKMEHKKCGEINCTYTVIMSCACGCDILKLSPEVRNISLHYNGRKLRLRKKKRKSCDHTARK